MARPGRHVQWPVGAWINTRTGETFAGIMDHVDFTLENQEKFEIGEADRKLLRRTKADPKSDKSEYLRRVIRRGWIRARGQYFDVPRLSEGALMDVYLYGREVGVHEGETVYVHAVETGKEMRCSLKDLMKEAEVAQPIEGDEGNPREVRIYVGLESELHRRVYERDAVVTIVSRYVAGASFLWATGLWERNREPSVVCTLLFTDEKTRLLESRSTVVEMTHDILTELGQYEVLVQWVFDDEIKFESFKLDETGEIVLANPYWIGE